VTVKLVQRWRRDLSTLRIVSTDTGPNSCALRWAAALICCNCSAGSSCSPSRMLVSLPWFWKTIDRRVFPHPTAENPPLGIPQLSLFFIFVSAQWRLFNLYRAGRPVDLVRRV